ncbi:hypothetical protein [Paraburkholderia terrae]
MTFVPGTLSTVALIDASLVACELNTNEASSAAKHFFILRIPTLRQLFYDAAELAKPLPNCGCTR